MSGATVRHEVHAQQTLEAMAILQRLTPDVLTPRLRNCFDNALLNVAVHRVIEVEGAQRTATILLRLAEAVLAEANPQEPVELTALHA